MTFRPQSVSVRTSSRLGFTLIEIMIVIGIIGIAMTAGVPLMWRALNKNDLSRAVHDITEGCKLARERAILRGAPYDFVITVDRRLNVAAAPVRENHQGSASELIGKTSEAGSTIAEFPRALGEQVELSDMFVNNIEIGASDVDEVRVRFYPNGTSDEFFIAAKNPKGEQRLLKTDLVTGLLDEITPP